VVWHRFWRPAAARTGPYGQPLFSGQRCKKRAKILKLMKWRQMRAFSNYVSEWCGGAVIACGYRVREPWRPRAGGRGHRVRGPRRPREPGALTACGDSVTARGYRAPARGYRAPARGYRAPARGRRGRRTRLPRPLHTVHAGGGTATAGGGTATAGGGTVTACGNRVITRSLRGAASGVSKSRIVSFPYTLSARCRLVARLAANRLLAFSKTAALGDQVRSLFQLF
jgi:hypothetical protein